MEQVSNRSASSLISDSRVECLFPSKYFAGSCYTYMKMIPATSWERAHNNCRTLSTSKDARLLIIDSIAEYEFVERDLIGPKSGSDSVSVYVGLRKINGQSVQSNAHWQLNIQSILAFYLDTWLWSNDVRLKDTPVYRFWVDTNKDILAFDCGALWLASNTSVLTPAPCAEQALRPYVCKHSECWSQTSVFIPHLNLFRLAIDRCYNNSGGCGKYGTCLNLPLMNSHRCQCRFLYAGHRCEKCKWCTTMIDLTLRYLAFVGSSQGLQAIIGGVIVVIAFIASYIINMDRSGDQWSFGKSTAEHYQT